MRLDQLFENCIKANYVHVENAGDYALKREGDVLYVYLEHSDGTEDWINNFDFSAHGYKRKGEKVWYAHRGFLRVWSSIEKYIVEAIADTGIKQITVVGYSHGGGLAVLCHEYVYYNRPDLRASLFGYGFGAPRVIWNPDGEIKKRLEHFTVVRNYDDAVTYLPPEVMGYKHVGRIFDISPKGSYSPIDAHREENILKELRRLYNLL